MRGRWLHSQHVTNSMIYSLILLAFLTEIMVVVSLLGIKGLGLPFRVGLILGTTLVVAAPAVAGLKGFWSLRRALGRLHVSSKVGPEEVTSQETTWLWISRQFLGAAICAYGAIIWNIEFLAGVAFKK